MNPSEQKDWLDEVLSNDNTYVDDNGFTEAVMRRLPPRRRGFQWIHAGIMTGAGGLSGVVLLASLSNHTALYHKVLDLALSQPIIGLGLFSATLCAVAGLAAGWMLDAHR